jgi:hypothetical protein
LSLSCIASNLKQYFKIFESLLFINLLDFRNGVSHCELMAQKGLKIRAIVVLHLAAPTILCSSNDQNGCKTKRVEIQKQSFSKSAKIRHPH